MRGESISNAHPAIRLFTLCEGFKWQLPAPGGVYEQNPVLMDKFAYMFSVRATVQAEEAKKREKDSKAKPNRPTRPAGGRKKR